MSINKRLIAHQRIQQMDKHFSVLTIHDSVKSSVNQEDLSVEQQLLHFERSQLRWFSHLGKDVVDASDWVDTTGQNMMDIWMLVSNKSNSQPTY